MIPDFEPITGYLPPGKWHVEWPQFCQHYGTNPQRAHLLERLQYTLQLLVLAGCTRVYLGGSFVTAKSDPPDFDGCFEMQGTNIFLLKELNQHADSVNHPGHLFPSDARFEGGTDCVTNYTRDDRKGEPDGTRGIVVLSLSGVPAIDVPYGSQLWYDLDHWKEDNTELDDYGVPASS